VLSITPSLIQVDPARHLRQGLECRRTAPSPQWPGRDDQGSPVFAGGTQLCAGHRDPRDGLYPFTNGRESLL